jgi:hypothetical protein
MKRRNESNRKRRVKEADRGDNLYHRYQRLFTAAPNAIDERTGGTFEQPSIYHVTRTFVTYGVGEKPIVNFIDA